jgi:hypothetical protein
LEFEEKFFFYELKFSRPPPQAFEFSNKCFEKLMQFE